MRIEYELKPDDWGAFGEYCARTSRQFQSAIARGILVVAVSAVAVTAVAAVRSNDLRWIAGGVVVAIVWALYWPRKMISNARTYMTGREQPCLRGRHVLDANRDGLFAKCDITESTTSWRGIQSIAETGSHVFVMLDEVKGYVIPKSGVVTGDIAEFVAEANRYRTGFQAQATS